jgi:tRNA uridine 5-carboxymethylaminomethyl modification enzyme
MSTWVNPRALPAGHAERVLGKPLEREHTLLELLKRPEVSYEDLMTLPGAGPGASDAAVAEQVEIQAKYAGYIARQQDEVARHAAHESTVLPRDLDFRAVRGLSVEVQQKLDQHRPETIGQASRIQGVTPAAISLLLVHLKRRTAREKDPVEKSAA